MQDNLLGFAAHYVIYTDDYFLEDSIASTYKYVDQILIARTTKPWHGKSVNLDRTERIIKRIIEKYGDKIEIFEDSFPDEQTQRNFLLEISKTRNHRGVFIIDCDEVFLKEAFQNIYKYIEEKDPFALRIPYHTFIKDASFSVAPPYEDNLFFVKPIKDAKFTWARKINLQQTKMPYPDPDILHFSYLRENDDQVWQKISNFMHIQDTDWVQWFNKIYKSFNPNLQNFHPVWPERWRKLQYFAINKLPNELFQKLKNNGHLFYYTKIKNKSNLKLHLGCGPIYLDDYVNIDYYNPTADLKLDITDLSYFNDSSVDEIFMNAVFEHIYNYEQIPALKEWLRILKPNGKLIIDSIPDFDTVIQAYIKSERANSPDKEIFDLEEVIRYTHGAYTRDNKLGQIHKDIFTINKVKELLTTAGFKIQNIKNVTWKDEPIPCNINLIATKPIIDQKFLQNEIEIAENLIDKNELSNAKDILSRLKDLVPSNPDILNDLAVIAILERDIQSALDYLDSVLLIDESNEIAKENFTFLQGLPEYRLFNKKIIQNLPSINLIKVTSFQEFQKYNQAMQAEYQKRNEFEKSLIQDKERFTVKGICYNCKSKVNFEVDFWNAYETNEGKIPNWRERLVCPSCGLNNRMRLSLHIIDYLIPNLSDSKVYIAEQTTPTFFKLSNKCKELTGSEFLGVNFPKGQTNTNGIRHEDFTDLSFGNNQFDLVLSFDVFEHIPDYKKSFEEASRVLKPDGKMIFSVPFDRNSRENIVRAKIESDGSLVHILPAEYHGDPMNIAEGCLCFYHFGWEILDDLKNAGFQNAYTIFVYSREYSYLGGEQILFVAEKN